jgi:hypothetical protein
MRRDNKKRDASHPVFRLELETDQEICSKVVAYDHKEVALDFVASFIKGIIEEGKQFASSAEGKSYLRTFSSSPLFKISRILWILGSMDDILARQVEPAPLSILFPISSGKYSDMSLEGYINKLFEVNINE